MDYETFKTELIKLADAKYRDFAASGTPTDYPFLGVRLPYLRDFAKKILKNHDAALDFINHEAGSFEELTTQGIVIAGLPYEEMLTYFDDYVDKIDNWGTCDTFCNSLKSIKKHRDDFLKKIDQHLTGPEFHSRVALVCLLDHYVCEPPKPFSADRKLGQAPLSVSAEKWFQGAPTQAIFERVNKIKDREEYYVKMAIAWLLAECFIKFPDETWDYLAAANLPKWTNNKTISKIRDSRRVDDTVKAALLTLRKSSG